MLWFVYCFFPVFCFQSFYYVLISILVEESEKNLPRKRHLATSGVSVGGRVTKVAKCKAASDDESDVESEGKSLVSVCGRFCAYSYCPFVLLFFSKT